MNTHEVIKCELKLPSFLKEICGVAAITECIDINSNPDDELRVIHMDEASPSGDITSICIINIGLYTSHS